MHGASSTKIKVLRLRLKDKHAKFLRHLAGEVNFVWNYCNELQITVFNREQRFFAQRAGRIDRVRAIHAKIANRRKDSLHQFSTRLVRGYDTIFVGNVNASALAKTPHAKSVLDAGWSAFRTMLRYKCDFAGATFAEVDEAFSTQTCSACDSRSGPKGIAGLGIRVWTCGECGAVHDRNVNAAKNILAAGRRRLAEGILSP
jgi:putative transposase